jgi:hypothetical protein
VDTYPGGDELLLWEEGRAQVVRLGELAGFDRLPEDIRASALDWRARLAAQR